jgi:hypothetical protein
MDASSRKRLLAGLGAYAALALLAALTLRGPFRIAIFILMAGLALKTWIATLRQP